MSPNSPLQRAGTHKVHGRAQPCASLLQALVMRSAERPVRRR